MSRQTLVSEYIYDITIIYTDNTKHLIPHTQEILTRKGLSSIAIKEPKT